VKEGVQPSLPAAFLDRPRNRRRGGIGRDVAPSGNAGSNTAADHIEVLRWALESLPPDWRPDLADPGGPQILVRCDSAGATHAFADACRTAGGRILLRLRRRWPSPRAAETLTESDSWYPAIDASGGIRDRAWVAEATDLVDMSHWPAGTRLILRKERPIPVRS
jgi:hypothetical protein